MKKIIVYMLLMLTTKFAIAQKKDTALYLQYPDVAPFSITKVPDSTKFSKADLKKDKAVMIMVFSPDCDHCIQEVKEIIAHIGLFKDIQIVMAARLDFHYLKTFYDEYKIASYPNITLGRDYSYFFGTFFNVQYLPAMYLYNKKGKFVRAFDGSVPVQKIATRLKPSH